MSFTSAPSVAPRWSDVYVSAIARAIDNGGDMLAVVALVLVLQQRGFGGLAVASLMIAAALPPMLLAPIAGRVADRFDSRHMLVFVGLVQVAICATLAFATAVPMIVGLVAALAVGMSFTSPTFSALTPSMVGRDNLAKASGILQTAGTIGSLLAPALGGLLVGAFGARVPLLIDAATYLAVPAAGLVLRTRRRGGMADGEPSSAPSPTAVSDAPSWSVWRDPLVRPLAVLFAAVVGALTAVNVVEVFFVRGALHASTTFYGVIGALWLAGMLVGTLLIARMKPDDGRSARIMFALLGGTCLVVLVAGLVPQAIWLAPLWIIGGITNGGENVLGGTLIGRRAPAQNRGHAYAIFGGLMNAATTIGLGLGGLLMWLTNDPRAIVLVTGIAGLAALIPFTAPLLRAARREAVHASTATEPGDAATVEPVADAALAAERAADAGPGAAAA
jgi:MFS family permease